ncbi:MAG TPA: cobalt ECF transporter T component CbiQ [Geobacteraceae bacterium]
MRSLAPQAHGDQLLVHVDARLKLLACLALLVLTISSRGLYFPLVAAGSGLGLCLTLGVRPRLLLARFAQPLFIATVVMLLKCFASGQVPLFTMDLGGWQLVAHADGLREGGLIAARIAGAVALVAAVGFATPFTELMAALAWLRVPQGLIEVALFAWRYLFVLLDDAQVVYAAQKNRLGYAGYRRGMRSFGTLAGAMVIKAFDSSQTITTAMVQRGYDGTMPLLRHKPFRAVEVVVSLAFVTGMALVWSL